MGEQESGKGVWAGLILAVVAAVVFAVLWFLRGGDMDALRGEMTRAGSAATSTVDRLENELATARNSITAETRKTAELETRLADELRRAREAGRTAESRLRADLAAANAQIVQATTKIAELEQTAAAADERAAVIPGLESRIAELTAGGETARQRAAAAEQQLAAAAEQANAAKAQADAVKTRLEARVNDAAAQFAAASQEAAGLRESLAETTANAEKALAAERSKANEVAAAFQKQLADLQAAAQQQMAAVRQELAEARRAAANTPAPAVVAAAPAPAAVATPAPGAAAVELTRLTAALAATEKARSEVAGELAAARKRAVERETARRDANETLQADVAALRNEITALRESASKSGNAEVKRLVDSLAAAEKTRSEFAAQLDAARKENAERETELRAAVNATEGMRAEVAASSVSIVDANQLIGEQSAQIDAANAARAQLLRQADGLRQRLSASHKRVAELEELAARDTGVDALQAELAAAKASREQLLLQADGLRQRLSASRKRANELEAALAEKVPALEQEARSVREETNRLVTDMREQLDAAKAETAKQAAAAVAAMEAAKKAIAAATVTVSVTPPAAPTPAAPVKPAPSAPAPAAPIVQAAPAPVAVNVPAITDAQRPALTIVRNPREHFGQLVELLSDGKTWLVSTAGTKDLKVGARFDIHRDANNRILYIGQLEIVSLLPDGFAMAAVRPDEAPVGICPATGRAVRFAQESPFARTGDGKAIAPVRSSAPAAATPAAGDAIDCQF